MPDGAFAPSGMFFARHGCSRTDRKRGRLGSFVHRWAEQRPGTGRMPVPPEVAEHESNLQHALRETELRLEARIAEAKADLTRWVIGAGILQTSIIIGVLLKVARLV